MARGVPVAERQYILLATATSTPELSGVNDRHATDPYDDRWRYVEDQTPSVADSSGEPHCTPY